MKLGTLHINSVQAVYYLRAKLYRLAQRMQEDEITATRFAAVTSQACKMLLTKSPILLTLEISDSISGSKVLNLNFSGTGVMDKPSLLDICFDDVDIKFTNTEGYLISSVKSLSPKFQSSRDVIDDLSKLINEKSRDELVEDVKAKNEELQESLENLRRTRTDKERMESELNIGREIQMSMLPLEFPPYPNRKELEIFALLKPAREVGGDFYDFFFIDEDHFCFCVGDVSGKGVPAALFMAVTKTMIKSKASDDYSTASIITQVNDELSRDNKSNMFITLFLCILNAKSGKLVYTNAGHNPPYLVQKGKEILRLETRHGPVIGAMEQMAYSEDSLQMQKQEIILLYTDGLTEAMNSSNELYSEKRLSNFLKKDSFKSAEVLLRECYKDVKIFEGGANQADDITLLGVQFTGLGKQVDQFELIIENKLTEISKFIESFSEFCKKSNLESAIIQKFNISADDMLNNIISYGYADDKIHYIKIEAIVYENRMTMILEDDGIPFNPFAAVTADTSSSLEDRKIGGLGIHLVQSIMDETNYHRLSEMNVVTLTLYI